MAAAAPKVTEEDIKSGLLGVALVAGMDEALSRRVIAKAFGEPGSDYGPWIPAAR